MQRLAHAVVLERLVRHAVAQMFPVAVDPGVEVRVRTALGDRLQLRRVYYGDGGGLARNERRLLGRDIGKVDGLRRIEVWLARVELRVVGVLHERRAHVRHEVAVLVCSRHRFCGQRKMLPRANSQGSKQEHQDRDQKNKASGPRLRFRSGLAR